MNIYITNLKTSQDRKLHMQKQLNGTKLTYEFVDCVIGADLSNEEIKTKCNEEAIKAQDPNNDWFTRGIIGCTLTNQNILNDMIQKGKDYIMVLEDDTNIPGNLYEMLEYTKTFIKQGDVILLFWKAWEVVKLPEPTITSPFNCNFYVPVNHHMVTGGSAYIVTRTAAQKMVAINTPLHTTPDNWTYYFSNKCVERLLVAYPLVVQTADFKSTMHTGRYVQVRNLIDKYRIFPFYQILKYRRNKIKTNAQRVEFVKSK